MRTIHRVGRSARIRNFMMTTLGLTLRLDLPKRLKGSDTALRTFKVSEVCQLCARDGELDPDCPYCELLREYTLTNEDFADHVQYGFHGTHGENQRRNFEEARRFE
jgi:hypothetical protein